MKKTLYERWSNNEIGGFGSFLTSLLQTYRLADNLNQAQLQLAFPDVFVDKK